MSEDSLFEEPQKRKVVLYCGQDNRNVKDFAAKIRNSRGAETVIVWAHKFAGHDTLIGCHAVIIEYGVENRSFIAQNYAHYVPDCEVHYMDGEGNWYTGEVEEVEQPIEVPLGPSGDEVADAPAGDVPVVQAEADAGNSVEDGGTDVPVEQSDDSGSEADGDDVAEASTDDAGSTEGDGSVEESDDDTTGASV